MTDCACPYACCSGVGPQVWNFDPDLGRGLNFVVCFGILIGNYIKDIFLYAAPSPLPSPRPARVAAPLTPLRSDTPSLRLLQCTTATVATGVGPQEGQLDRLHRLARLRLPLHPLCQRRDQPRVLHHVRWPRCRHALPSCVRASDCRRALSLTQVLLESWVHLHAQPVLDARHHAGWPRVVREPQLRAHVPGRSLAIGRRGWRRAL